MIIKKVLKSLKLHVSIQIWFENIYPFINDNFMFLDILISDLALFNLSHLSGALIIFLTLFKTLSENV